MCTTALVTTIKAENFIVNEKKLLGRKRIRLMLSLLMLGLFRNEAESHAVSYILVASHFLHSGLSSLPTILVSSTLVNNLNSNTKKKRNKNRNRKASSVPRSSAQPVSRLVTGGPSLITSDATG